MIGINRLDVVRVGDAAELPLGVDDRVVLAWAEDQARILITEDRHSMAGHLQAYLASGRRSPGVLVTRSRTRVRDLVEILELIAYAGNADEYADAITHIP